jgi:hypothetical protein
VFHASMLAAMSPSGGFGVWACCHPAVSACCQSPRVGWLRRWRAALGAGPLPAMVHWTVPLGATEWYIRVVTKSGFTCGECGQGLHPRDPGVRLIGFTGDGPQYRHGGACEEAGEERRLNTDQCRWCKKSFRRRPDPHRAGRPAEHCGDKCRKAAGRASARLWRMAARGDVPDTVEESIRRINAVGALYRDLLAGRFNGSTPDAARDTLIGYTRRLEKHRDKLVEAQKLERERRRAEAMREVVGARRQADEDSWKIFLGGLDSAED